MSKFETRAWGERKPGRLRSLLAGFAFFAVAHGFDGAGGLFGGGVGFFAGAGGYGALFDVGGL